MSKEMIAEIEEVLRIASWAAGKMHVSLVRGEVSRRAEFEALADARDRITELRRKLQERVDE